MIDTTAAKHWDEAVEFKAHGQSHFVARAGQVWLALDARNVSSVMDLERVSPVPMVPPYILGGTDSYRGEICAIRILIRIY